MGGYQSLFIAEFLSIRWDNPSDTIERFLQLTKENFRAKESKIKCCANAGVFKI